MFSFQFLHCFFLFPELLFEVCLELVECVVKLFLATLSLFSLFKQLFGKGFNAYIFLKQFFSKPGQLSLHKVIVFFAK